jgi:uncharacterized protein (TIGR02996 family)
VVATLVDWCKAVDAAPLDATVRLLWADALDDDGRHLEAECLRWAASGGKRPWPYDWGHVRYGWYFDSCASAAYHSHLPDGLFDLLERLPGDEHVGKYYPSVAAAWLALTDAYRRWKCPTP